MWIEKVKTGYAFREWYVDPLTNKKKESVCNDAVKDKLIKKSGIGKAQRADSGKAQVSRY